MERLGELWRRLLFLFRGGQFDRDLEEEMRFHLEMRSAESGNLAARRRFGNATLFEEDSRGAWGWRWLEDLAADMRYALRTLRRNPGFTAATVLTLALGIGVNTAMFSVLYGTCLAPLPYRDPERLVDVSMMHIRMTAVTGRRLEAGTSWLNLSEWQSQSHLFDGLAAHEPEFYVNLTGLGEAEEVQARRLSAGVLRLLGVAPALGRWFAPEEDMASGPRSALIAHAFWRSRFGGDPNVVGKRVFVDGQPFTIVGVMPPAFVFPPLMGAWSPVIWLSLNLTADTAGMRAGHSLSVTGRLKPGVTIGSARSEMAMIAARLSKAYPKENGEWPAAKVTRLSDVPYVTEFRSTLWFLLGAAGLVLLIACANVANLLLARGASREHDFAVRVAIGASRARLARQVFTESCVLAGAGCALGVLLAFWSLPLLKSLLVDRPRVQEIAITPAVLVFAAVIATLTVVLFAAWPAIRAGVAALALRAAGRVASPRQRFRKALVTVEIALGLLLLSAAGLLIESFWRASHVNLGFRPERVLTARLTLPTRSYDTGRRVEAFREELLQRVRALPGVDFAGTNSAPPMGVLSQGTDFEVEGQQETPGAKQFASFANVSRDYLQAMGIPLLRGRRFAATDHQGTMAVAIVSESVARLFPGKGPLGCRLRLARLDNAQWFTVIGVAADVRNRLEDRPEGAIYALSSQLPETRQGSRAARVIVLVLRTAKDPLELAGAVRRIVTEIDKDQPVADIATMEQAIDRALAGRRLSTLLVGLFAGLAVVLAAIGVFGLVSYAVTCRTNEIGIRMALGARRSGILAMITRETLAFGLGGVAVGIAGSLGTSRLLASMLYEVKPAAPHILLASAAFLVATMIFATLFAARRAIGVDPVVALRQE